MTPPPEEPPPPEPSPDPGDTPLDLSAILGSERELGDVAGRRTPWQSPTTDPIHLLAALAADVDDDTPVPGTAPATPAAPGRAEPAAGATPATAETPGVAGEGVAEGETGAGRGRRWGVALAGVAAAVVAMTGVAAAGSSGFSPISGLFEGAPTTEPVAGSPVPHTGGRTGTPEAPQPTHAAEDPHPPATPRHAEPRTRRYAPALKNPAHPFTHRRRADPTTHPAGPRPKGTPTDGETGTPSPTPSATSTRWWPPRPTPSKGLLRLERSTARGTPADG